MRICGDCSECCRLLKVELEDYQKPSGLWCKYCTQPGCGIWGTVKQEKCREFDCGWLQNENIPENLKPNRSIIASAFPGKDECPTPISKYKIGRRLKFTNGDKNISK